jgi:hypothetical protein
MGFFDKFFRKSPPPEPAGASQPASLPEVAPGPSSRLAELAVDSPFPVTAHRGDQVELDLLVMRGNGNSEGVAVILGDYEAASRTFGLWDESFSMEQELGFLEKADFEAWIAAAKEDEDFEEDDGIEHEEIYPDGVSPMTALTVGWNYKGHVVPEVFIARLPTPDPVMIPLHLRFGDWNSCPSPWVHAAAARYWEERYGASIVTLAGDIIEYVVERPPATDAQALELAWQQYYYCHDIVTQGVGSVATLAQSLKGSSRWYFWWD